MTFRFLVISLLCCAASFANNGDNLLCITDKVTGFNRDAMTGAWERSSFLPGEQFLITASGVDQYTIERLDENRPWSASCRHRTEPDVDSFTCEAGTNTVHFNRKTRKFTAFSYFGYWSGSSDSLSIAIGVCAPA